VVSFFCFFFESISELVGMILHLSPLGSEESEDGDAQHDKYDDQYDGSPTKEHAHGSLSNLSAFIQKA